MTCRECYDFLADYVSGELPDEPRRVFERHLRDCPPCVRYVRQYEQTIRLGKRALDPECGDLPRKMPEALVKAILEARKKLP